MLELIEISWIGERWALASLPEGEPFSLYIWRDRALDVSARCGDVLPAIVRSIDKSGAMGFVEIAGGESAFFNVAKSRTPPAEGARIHVLVKAEAYGGKLANVTPTDRAEYLQTDDEAYSAWLGKLPSEVQLNDTVSFAHKVEAMRAALELASADTITIDNGGALHIDQTRALTAVDVDSSGRIHRSGMPGLNSDALKTLARHIGLRRVGGLIVVDVEGAPKGEKARALSAQFEVDLRSSTGRQVKVLAPSMFGLIEATVARGEKPIREYVPATCWRDRAGTEYFLSALRECVALAESDRTGFFELHCSAQLSHLMKQITFDWQSELTARTGGRVKWVPSSGEGLSYRIELL